MTVDKIFFYVLRVLLNFHVFMQLCFYGCLPGCIMKQFVNIVQLASASHAIAEEDAAARKTK